MKKQIRIAIPHGTATVDEDCPKETIEALHQLAELAYKMPSEQLNKPDVSNSVCVQTGFPCGAPCYHKCPLYDEIRKQTGC